MDDALEFSNRAEFREWLNEHCADSKGVWLLFGKKGGPITLTANDALEEALCFGWIDGQMQSLDKTKYKKYFTRRTKNSNWSEKNKKLAQILIESGSMTRHGFDAIEHAKKTGTWNTPEKKQIDDEQIEDFRKLVSLYEPAYSNLLTMSLSVQKNYTGFYLDAKSPKTRQMRLEKIIDRLNKNLKPM
jgi:Uncharacterized protein conserved in bacteria